MSKPSIGIRYFIICPSCGYHKATTVEYVKYTKFKCTKCKFIWYGKG